MLATIRQNSTGDIVKVAQYLTGYVARKKATGKYDAAFVAWVCRWQKKYGLTPDGIIGPKTWTMLAQKAPVCSTSKNSASAATCALQVLLGDLVADGLFGTNTKKAVSAYQSAKGLKVDGCVGINTWTALITGTAASVSSSTTSAGTTTAGGKTLNNCVHYIQWDSKWSKLKYSTHTSSQTIGNSGCGPSSMAMIMATLIDPKITPVEMCALAVANGYRTYDSGTAWGFYQFVFKKYPGFSKFITTTSVETLKAALAQGALAVCSMNSNDNNFWTKGGHFIVAIGFDDAGYIYANDPNKSAHPRKQLATKFAKCLKQAFIFWPEKKESASPFEPVDDADTTNKAIIDISYHKGKIDFDLLAPHVQLVIPRASCGSDIDTRFIEYANALTERKIPMGVFCYSYARDAAKGEDEAVKIVKYAGSYNPLFYVIDMEETCITHDGVKAFVKTLRDLGIERIGAYVAHHHYDDYRFDELRHLFDFVWIPRYALTDIGEPNGYKPAWPCDLWQFTEKGRFPGINSNVDVNLITGAGKTLGWFLGGDM